MDKKIKEKPSLLILFLTFAKIGVMTFGGGYAMLPMLERELVVKYKWCTETDILDYFAIGQATPGIIAVNTATLVGHKVRGNIGGIVATLGIVFPSYVIISILASVLEIFNANPYVQMAFAGIRVAVCSLITLSIIKMSKKSIVDISTFIIFISTFFCMVIFNPSPIVFILIGILLGISISLVKVKKKEAKK